AGSLRARLRREERIEDLVQVFARNAGPGVHDMDGDARSGRPRAHDEQSVGHRVHRLLGVHDEIDQHLLEIGRVRPDGRQVATEVLTYVDVTDAERIASHLQHVTHDVVHVHAYAFCEYFLCVTREQAQIRHDAAGARGL